MNRIIRRLALPVGAAVLVGSGGFAYMAQNIQPPTSAGYSSNSVNGFDVEQISYRACGTSSSNGGVSVDGSGNFCQVEFNLKPRNGGSPANNGSNVQAAVNNGAFKGACIYLGAPGSNQGTRWRCSITPVTTADLESLQVVAAQ